MRIRLLLILSIIILNSCKISSTHSNEEIVKEEAIVVVDKFYELIKKQQWDALIPLFSTQTIKASSKEEILGFIKRIHEQKGEFTSKTIDDWGSFREQVNYKNTVHAFFVLHSIYSKDVEVKERIDLMKEGEKFKILSYNINE